MELVQLKQLVAVAQEKVLSHAAEKLNISQPALSRSIQNLERELGLQLFDRKKNSMTLNAAGSLAVEQAKLVLEAVENLTERLDTFKNDSRTLRLATCAPAPLWKLSAELGTAFPKLTILSEMPDEDEIISLLLSEKADLAIVRKEIESESIETVPFMSEQLFMQIPLSDPLSEKSSITFADLAGREIREYTQTGFWHKLHRDNIPDAAYIEYSDFMVYANVVKSQNPLTFVTELGSTLHAEREGCVTVPITDTEATAHYRLAFLKKNCVQLQDIVGFAQKEARKW